MDSREEVETTIKNIATQCGTHEDWFPKVTDFILEREKKIREEERKKYGITIIPKDKK